MKATLLRELRSGLGYMSSAQRRIAEAILSNPTESVSLSLSELSERAGVSQGSIINFANKFSGGGFPSLKTDIAASLAEDTGHPFSTVSNSDSMTEIFAKTAKNIADALGNTAALNDEKMLSEVCEMILRARRVEIYGVYRSAVVATDFYFQLLRLGIPANFVSDVLTCAISATTLGEGSLVIAISSSGQTKDVLDAVSLAKANGVQVVALTADKGSPLAAMSDKLLLAAPCGNALSTSDTEIRMSQLCITDAICAYLQMKMDADGSERFYKMSEILRSHNVRD